jgi:elongator complex protein 3
LYTLWKQGQYAPYPEETLIELLIQCKALVQPYSRINRLMRDIPAHYIVAGTTKSNLRQIVQTRMQQRALACQCIRCREVRGKEIAESGDATLDTLSMNVLSYATDATQEYFMQYLTRSGHVAAFLRLSLPTSPRDELPIPEIREAAMVRELHVYGPAQALGQRDLVAQHRGLGTQLLDAAAEMSREAGFLQLAVIAAAGTRPYYRARGFTAGNLYTLRAL